jgi:hypothetical protein
MKDSFTEFKEGDKRTRKIFLFWPLTLNGEKKWFGFFQVQETLTNKRTVLYDLNQESYIINKLKWIKTSFYE